MAQTHPKTTDGSERAGGYIRDTANAAKAGIDQATEYVEDATSQASGYVRGVLDQAQEKGAAVTSRRIDEVWADTLKFTRQRPGTALLIAGAVGLALSRLMRRGS